MTEDFYRPEEVQQHVRAVIAAKMSPEQVESFLWGLQRTGGDDAENAIASVVQKMDADDVTARLAKIIYPNDPNGPHKCEAWWPLRAAAINHHWLSSRSTYFKKPEQLYRKIVNLERVG